MTTAAVQATVFVLLTFVATWAGLLIAVALLLPTLSLRAEQQLQALRIRTPLLGALLIVPIGFGVTLLKVHQGGSGLVGFLLLDAMGALLAIGAAGIAQTIGRRGEPETLQLNFRMLFRGSLTLSLAMGFPFIGWFLFAPLAILFALGAGLQAVIPPKTASFASASSLASAGSVPPEIS